MTEQDKTAVKNTQEAVTDEQLVRAVTSFEAIIVSQIEIKNILGDRLNYSIRTGLIILGLIAISILILLLTLSSQITRISAVVGDMNQNFTSVSTQMENIDTYITSMEKRVSLLGGITSQTETMDREMGTITTDLRRMRWTLKGIQQHVKSVDGNIAYISSAIDKMNFDIQRMGHDMHRMGQPARSMNNMFPLP
ncbi:MAG: translation initiation factor 2 [endosymbiont of Seepiophila jonesi]|uniref:Translation initiation factor 2 n=1 Tax=endosymbiont of Lamellibrachia luymesi TaxID=2200907 RepID=A0A370DIU8_9GAMM|nr:MAG: translation initiation factor 2 [endosymbiont of Lamellibrachia luymesi]RDH88251.1 MAG: translation initiation factor 2 [endosymbiont of Seepiophila jonesi]